MTEAELGAKLGLWRDRLALGDWRLILKRGGCEDETAYMETQRSVLYQRAVIHYQPWLFGEGEVPEASLMRDDAVEIFLHDGSHIAGVQVEELVDERGLDEVVRDVHEQLENAMKRAEEQCVDRLAEALVRAFSSGR